MAAKTNNIKKQILKTCQNFSQINKNHVLFALTCSTSIMFPAHVSEVCCLATRVH